MSDTIIILYLLCWPFLVALVIAGIIVWVWQWLEQRNITVYRIRRMVVDTLRK